MKKEIWLPVKGYEGLYEVSDSGNVRRVANLKTDSIGRKMFRETRPIKQFCPRRYNTVRLSNIKLKSFKVHRLVALAFIPNPQNKPEVNHIDGCRTNNIVSNLEWCTPKENVAHSVQMGLHPVGVKNGRAKCNDKEVLVIRGLYKEGRDIGSLANEFNVGWNTIRNIVNNVTWKHVV